MAKKKIGRFVALATVTGVVAAGISYFLRYKSFHDELNDEFHEFEDEEFDGELPHENEVSQRTYVSLNEKKENPEAKPADAAAEKPAQAEEETTVSDEEAPADDAADHVSEPATTIVEDDTLDL